MGGCCSAGELDKNTELQTSSLQPIPSYGRIGANRDAFLSQPTGLLAAPPAKPAVSDAAVREFLHRAADGFPVVVLLSSGHGLECSLKLDEPRQLVVLSKDDLKRETPFHQITKVLSSVEDLTRIKTDARLDDNCSALYTQHDSSCVVFAFDTLQENQAFVQAAKNLMERR